MPKITHIISTPAEGNTLADHLKSGPIAIYGRKDLKTRLSAAKKAGIKVTVRKAPKD